MGTRIHRVSVSTTENAAPEGAAFASANRNAHLGHPLVRPVPRSLSQEAG